MDYQIQPNSRRCAVTGRQMQPGERYYTALLEVNHQFVRQDYSQESWQGPPAGAFSFWTGLVQTGTEKTKPRFDDDLLEECFQRLEGQAEPSRVNFRYVVALLLMRRKRFRFETSMVEAGMEKMTLRCLRTNQKHEVVNPRLSDNDMAQVQEEVFNVLGWK
jgi:hypothetical protein